MARKHKEEERENHERWLVSYADFITLLFAFFVVMYSISRVDSKRMKQAAESIKWALHNSGTGGIAQLPIFEGPVSMGGTVAGSDSDPQAPKNNDAKAGKIKMQLEQVLQPFLQGAMEKSVQMEIANGRLTIRLAAGTFFDASSSALRPEVLPLLDAVGEELRSTGRPVRVEAHTDDGNVSNGRYRNNWDLSAARAATVTHFLDSAHHIAPKLLSAAGMGSARPLVPNTSPKNREANRRVEMVVDLYSKDVSAAVAE